MRAIGSIVLLGAVVGGVIVACSGRDAPEGLNPSGMGTGGIDFVSAIASPSSSGSGASQNVVSDPAAPCDNDLAFDSLDPYDAAAAVGLCTRVENAGDWGLVEARWTMADGSDATVNPNYAVGHGILDAFGSSSSPQEGERFLALSSGTARQPGHPDYVTVQGFDKGYTSSTPAGYPKESPACVGVTTGPTHDDVALEVTLRAPPNAESLAFDFNFYTFEWPIFVCSEFNDFFLAFMDPAPEGQSDGNISFDSLGNVVSVNNALVRVCSCAGGAPCSAPPDNPIISYDCEEGPAELAQTGFEGSAATSWLVTRAPVEPDEEVSLRWTIYDSGDGVLDSTVIIDNFRWLGDPASDPVTEPK